jgi:(2Fe-2S) ferredoxin
MTDNSSPQKRRIVLCVGEFCNMDRRAGKLLPKLEAMLNELNQQNEGKPDKPFLKLETARCLSMCGAGPNCVIYPEDIVTNGLNEAKLVRMVDEHLRG